MYMALTVRGDRELVRIEMPYRPFVVRGVDDETEGNCQPGDGDHGGELRGGRQASGKHRPVINRAKRGS